MKNMGNQTVDGPQWLP